MKPVDTLCIGNCQSMNLQKELLRQGCDARFFLFPALLLGDHAPISEARKWLARFFDDEGLQTAITQGLVRLIPSASDLSRYRPKRVVINLLHEYPCWEGSLGGRLLPLTVAVPPLAVASAPDLMPAVEKKFHFQDVAEDETYFSRFRVFALGLRALFPDAHFVIYKRLSHSRRYGPVLSSDLSSWGQFWRQGQEAVEMLCRELGNASILDMDKLAVRIMCGESGLDAVVPLQVRLWLTRNRNEVRIVRDLEHPSGLLTRVAAQQLLSSEKTSLSASERIALEQIRTDIPAPLEKDEQPEISAEILSDHGRLAALVAGYVTSDIPVDWDELSALCGEVGLVVRNMVALSVLCLVRRGSGARKFLRVLLDRSEEADGQYKVQLGLKIVERAARVLDMVETDFSLFDGRQATLCCQPPECGSLHSFLENRGVPVEIARERSSEGICVLAGNGLEPEQLAVEELLEAINWAAGNVVVDA